MNFYYLAHKNDYYYHVLSGDTLTLGEANQVVRGESTSKRPTLFRVFSGRSGGDFLSSSLIVYRLISDKFRDVLLENKINGFESTPVDIVDKKKHIVSGYNLLIIHGKSKSVSFSSNVVEETSPYNPNKRFVYRKGILIDLDSWDGSSIFMADNMNYIFLDEKTANVISNAKLKGVVCADVSSLKTRIY